MKRIPGDILTLPVLRKCLAVNGRRALNMEWIYRVYRPYLIYGLYGVLLIHPIIRSKKEKEQVGMMTDEMPASVGHPRFIGADERVVMRWRVWRARNESQR